MQNINLLPWREQRAQQWRRSVSLIFIGVTLLMLLALVGYYIYLRALRAERYQHFLTAQSQFTNLVDRGQGNKPAESKPALKQQFLLAREFILRDRKILHLLNSFARLMPPTCYLQHIKVVQKTIHLVGGGNLAGFGLLYQRLGRYPGVKSVVLLSITKTPRLQYKLLLSF